MTQSLGQKLAQLVALNKPESNDINSAKQQAARAQRAVTNFFTDAKAHIVEAIEAGVRPSPYPLGSGPYVKTDSAQAAMALETFQWPFDQPQPRASNPYRSHWDQFVQWATQQGLRVHFCSDHDGMGVHSWYLLCVNPVDALVSQQEEVAEGAVVLPKEIMTRFGSAQAYLEYLESQTKSR